jgi:hypothetical protein
MPRPSVLTVPEGDGVDERKFSCTCQSSRVTSRLSGAVLGSVCLFPCSMVDDPFPARQTGDADRGSSSTVVCPSADVPSQSRQSHFNPGRGAARLGESWGHIPSCTRPSQRRPGPEADAIRWPAATTGSCVGRPRSIGLLQRPESVKGWKDQPRIRRSNPLVILSARFLGLQEGLHRLPTAAAREAEFSPKDLDGIIWGISKVHRSSDSSVVRSFGIFVFSRTMHALSVAQPHHGPPQTHLKHRQKESQGCQSRRRSPHAISGRSIFPNEHEGEGGRAEKHANGQGIPPRCSNSGSFQTLCVMAGPAPGAAPAPRQRRSTAESIRCNMGRCHKIEMPSRCLPDASLYGCVKIHKRYGAGVGACLSLFPTSNHRVHEVFLAFPSRSIYRA